MPVVQQISNGNMGLEDVQVSSGIGSLEGLGSALSIAYHRLVVSDGEWGAFKEGVGQYGGAHTGGRLLGVISFVRGLYAR